MELGTMETGWCAYTYELTDARGHQGNENLEPPTRLYSSREPSC